MRGCVETCEGDPGHRDRCRNFGSGIDWLHYHVGNFSGDNQTYGRIAAVIVLMLWRHLSACAVLLRAEIDAVRERDKDVTCTTPDIE